MRLIDADKLMKQLNECFYDTTNPAARRAAHDTIALCQSLVDEQPTAYDVDKVVEQLKRNSMPFMEDKDDRDVDLDSAIKIVKSGGIE